MEGQPIFTGALGWCSIAHISHSFKLFNSHRQRLIPHPEIDSRDLNALQSFAALPELSWQPSKA
jgi:hypothetical protein